MAIKFAPLTGSTPTALEVPDQQTGSDDATHRYRRLAGDVTLTRAGIAVSVRPWKNVMRWHFNYNLISESQVFNIREYFLVRTFYLQPYGTAFVQHPVRWVDPEFNPVQVKPGFYSLAFTLEEVLT